MAMRGSFRSSIDTRAISRTSERELAKGLPYLAASQLADTLLARSKAVGADPRTNCSYASR